ncbi:hypothetical protein [Stenotrophomonas sp. TWI1183]|uniref:hypothetical protein n=1 Tax=Stenotrophomonas sp. TWI1183 TaxID=3136799 RepID=UPI003208A014
MKRALFVAAVVFLASSPSPAQATSRFVEIPAGGWDPGPELRRQHEGSIVDWVRRVDVHPDALFDDSIEVDLFDLKVRLQRVAGHPPGEASDPVHVLAVQNGGASSEIIPSRLRWAGKTASSSSPCTDVEGTVRVSEGSDGRLQAIFDIGSFRYELRGGVLIRKDLRRLPREAPVRDVSPAVRGAPLPKPGQAENQRFVSSLATEPLRLGVIGKRSLPKCGRPYIWPTKDFLTAEFKSNSSVRVTYYPATRKQV